MTDLNESAGTQLPSVNDQRGSVPEGQSIAQKNDAPQVPLKYSYDCALFDAPVLSFHKVFIVSVRKTYKPSHSVLLKHPGRESSTSTRNRTAKTPFGFLVLAAERRDGSDGGQDLVSHGARLGVGLQLSSRQPGHSLEPKEIK